jgi:hypothetical protein
MDPDGLLSSTRRDRFLLRADRGEELLTDIVDVHGMTAIAVLDLGAPNRRQVCRQVSGRI